MLRNKFGFSIQFFVLSLCFFFFVFCGKSYPIEKVVETKLDRREGKPELFQLNGAAYSASAFRDELVFERSHFELKQEFPPPEELEKYLNRYIEDTVILKDAVTELDLNSPEAAAYLWPYLRKGIIAYYLDKKSGVFEINNNFPDIEIRDKDIEEFYQNNKGKLPEGLSEKEAKRKLENTARYLKWKKIYEIRNDKKKEVVGALKKNNSVQIKYNAINKVIQD
ncbi:hypothetical protein [Leptospira kmetyi]|uniref:Lipoprotein n=1 Tax=Leptospira kmetyi TaxID=408139 RepID=A0A2M9XS93_9LEPT|nr:hypothetical protein [Leptospira kmetyi]AYV56417.1 hypothetical protein EFP84_13480 [Leptospira kmetyi]PJZ28926.1 hypothetical protein CH378_15340 [Leptospira kmetyi]PJZ42177.1 hypothetical protein CH370_08035 [Leptospira kmetyi]TGK10733.1 hypothetical protein EHO62_19890 [Leptospira kmetyi]TGK25015.1 hypothetical protein EHO66_19380 [Leptospira kmetyi]